MSSPNPTLRDDERRVLVPLITMIGSSATRSWKRELFCAEVALFQARSAVSRAGLGFENGTLRVRQ
jgi:hypothetical protein